MKKNLKLLVIGLLVAVAATLTCALIPACGGDGNNETAYTIKVVCNEDNFDYTQITAQWCAYKSNHEIGSCYKTPVKLNANGEATWDNLPEDFIPDQAGWHAQINIPTALKNQGYGYDEASQLLYATKPCTVTITLTKTN